MIIYILNSFKMPLYNSSSQQKISVKLYINRQKVQCILYTTWDIRRIELVFKLFFIIYFFSFFLYNDNFNLDIIIYY